MFIKPLKCENCGSSGRIGDTWLSFKEVDQTRDWYCQCGASISIPNEEIEDQYTLSNNDYYRILGTSNWSDSGSIIAHPGKIITAYFKEPFDIINKVEVVGSPGILAKEYDVKQDRIDIITSFTSDYSEGTEPVIFWKAFGLVDIDKLAVWYVHFYSAIRHTANKLYKPAILDYAISFEAFIEQYLRRRITALYNQRIAEFILERSWKVEERVKSVLEISTGHRLTEREDLYKAWNENVRQLRNRLAHGEYIEVNRSAADKAHEAVYQSIRWIESL